MLRWTLIYCGIVAVFLFLERSLVFRPEPHGPSTWFPPLDPREFDDPNALTQRVFDVLSPTVIAHAEQAHPNLVRLGDLAQGVKRQG